MLVPSNVHESWKDFLTEDILEELSKIEWAIGSDYTPSKENILRFLTLDINKVKVVVLGQDPYYQENVANGRAFQPNDLTDWKQSYRNNSVKNIVRLVHKLTEKELVKYSQVNWETFDILPPKEWFDSLENQGVLFLNTAFTCKLNKPKSHTVIWFKFIKYLLNYMSLVNTDITWILFGKEATSHSHQILTGIKIECPHPMMGTKEFFECDCLDRTSSKVNWKG